MSQETRWVKLSERTIIKLFVYYITLLLLSIGMFLLIVYFEYIYKHSINKTILAIWGSMSMSLCGSSIYYIRKLYKLCIQDKIGAPNVENRLQVVGILIYFVIRPVFAIMFGVLVVLGTNVGILSMTNDKINLNNGFIDFCMFISFIIGFSSGKVINNLENSSDKIIKKLFGMNIGG
jgi:hypothetical protein